MFGCIIFGMKQEVVLQILKQKNAELTKQFGVKSLLLFGSVARNEASPTSDVDLLVEFNRPVGYFGLFALQDYLEKLLGCPVDLGTPDSLKPHIRDRVMGELIRVAWRLAGPHSRYSGCNCRNSEVHARHGI